MRSTEWLLVFVLGAATPAIGLAGPACEDLDGEGLSSCAGNDCDDTRSDVNPLRPESCGDAADNNCNGLTDCNDEAVCPAIGPPLGASPG